MIQPDDKSSKELLTRRIFLAVVSSVTLQFFFVCCLVLFANLSTDYVHWLQETWSIVTSLRMWTFLVIFTTVVFLQAVFCRRVYLHTPPYYKSRFTKLLATFTAQNLYLGTLYVIIGGILIWFHLLLKGGRYSSLIADCSVIHGTCLVEEYSFLLFSGLWSGLYFSFKTRSSIGRYFRFPIIAQSKFFQFRRRIYTALPTLMLSSLWSTLYYMTVYYFVGSYCHMVLLFTISMQAEVELDTMSMLLNLSLILQLWFYQFVFVLTINSTYLFFEVYLTEWTQFKFGLSGALSTDGSELTLIEALSMDKIPIMQHLGYLDLVTLAQKEKARRATLFTLSQPGGHPYNWNCVVQRCTDLLNKFSSDLNAISVKPQPPLTCYGKSVLTTMGRPTQQKDRVYHMRKLVPDVAPTLTAVETITQETSYTGLLAQFVKQKRDAFVTYLLSKPLINYIFGEQDENKIRYVLFNSQPVMWAAEAISSLSVFSLTEDHHGIVQKDIPTIVNALLSVKQALDKQQKSVILARRLQTEDKLIREIFTSLRSAIKRSLYRIVTNFEPYINDLCLESAAVEQLQSFLNYKE
ncbi:hypothetical protein DMN91_008336 [Ooceraea biroi]|uniref:Nucleoporin Ndc1 n=1 Tax=Ooceraea biroi TaxID=2015173 RepID=A0A3L8DIV4_OOCBI|nr:nucleoporin Ndc1 [Ooceraea biroi]RLU19778.1 hypothetical protein DMN91_008336 [Ooceraea biroi]